MSDHQTYQVHANANADHGDLALRISITFYDETGHQTAHSTWRKHVRDLTFAGSDWQAYSAICEMAKMLAEITGSATTHDELDNPLF